MLRYIKSIEYFCQICKDISLGIENGLSIYQIITDLQNCYYYPPIKKSLKQVKLAMDTGQPLHHALDIILPKEAPLTFSDLEACPKLDTLCHELYQFYTDYLALIKAILNQLRYPVFLLFFIIAMFSVFYTVLLPQLSSLYSSTQEPTSISTVNYSKYLLAILFLIVSSYLLIPLAKIRYFFKKLLGIYYFERYYLFSVLSLMLNSGYSLFHCQKNLSFKKLSHLSHSWTQLCTDMNLGKDLSVCFRTHFQLNDYDIALIQSSPKLHTTFSLLSKRYYMKLMNYLTLLTSIFKPTLLIIISILITYMIITFFQPLFQYTLPT